MSKTQETQGWTLGWTLIGGCTTADSQGRVLIVRVLIVLSLPVRMQ